MTFPLGLYIHIPFCRHKCFYCDFHSVPGKDELIGGYITAVIKEIQSRASMAINRKIGSIFFGGGTPSLLSPEHAEAILDTCRKSFGIAPNAEITMEMNPESVEAVKLSAYLASGVNRASIGVQSLNGKRLKFLERVHTAGQARKAIETAFLAGFENVSADFMYSLPGQTMDEWLTGLETAAGWGISHISCYELTPEEATPLGRAVKAGEVNLAENGVKLFDATESALENRGFVHYEISNYARPGRECVHNLGYWKYRDYIGVGAGAHGFINGGRWENVRDIETYISQTGDSGMAVKRAEKVTGEMEWTERLMLGLRMKNGIPFGGAQITDKIKSMISGGMLEYAGGNLRATAKGWRLLDSVLANV
ncbi:MAG: radical SAM family heme chaperone HemW [Nitrospinae bacterium]|nr:radical SAM family heme chaperone HemW [Nitrospinota bacterium]